MLATWVLAGSLLITVQAPPSTTFSSEVYVIPMVVRVYERGGKIPKKGIKAEDISLKVDGKVRPVVRVTEMADEKGPYFLIGFEPTDADRDGRPHKGEINVKGLRKTLKVTLTPTKK